MANEIKLIISVDDKGSLKITTAEANKAAKAVDSIGAATDRTKKSRDAFLRGEKGVAGATSNSTKAFSKMNQGLGGNTGLVQMYAILASNVFAATAAFNALKRVAEIEQLGKGLQFVGNVIGRDLKGAAEQLREITGEAVSLSQAMRTTAVGVSAGFKGEELEGLAKIAKGASIALGRDMGDALDRLVRGTAKLEPEILDELGIMVRLDTAAQDYATSMGVSVRSLSQFERQQAFLNATLEQGLEKYGDIADAIDPNAYDQLSASLLNLATSTISSLNEILHLNDGITFLSKNIIAMAGVVGLALLPITKRLVPGLFNMAQASAEAAEETAKNNRALLGNLNITGKMPKGYAEVSNRIKEGTATTEDFTKANNSLRLSLQTNTKWLATYNKEYGADDTRTKQKQKDIANVIQRQKELAAVQAGELTLAAKRKAATAIELASQKHLILGLKTMSIATKDYAASLAIASINTGVLTKTTNTLKVALFGLVGTIKTVGAAFLAWLPWLGLIISIGTIVWAKLFPADPIKEQIKEAEQSFANFAEIFKQFDESSAEGGTRVVKAYVAWAGILDEIKGKMDGIGTAVAKVYAEELLAIERRRTDIRRKTKEIANNIATDMKVAGEEAGDNFVVGFLKFLVGIETGAQRTARRAAHLASLEAEALALSAQVEEQNRKSLQDQLQAKREMLDLAMHQLNVSKQAAQDQGILEIVGDEEISKIKEMADIMSSITLDNLSTGQMQAFIMYMDVGFEKIQRNSLIIRDVFQSAQDAVLKFNTEMNKLQQKATGPFDNIIDSADILRQKFIDLERTDIAPERKIEVIAQLNEEIKDLNIKESFGSGREAVEAIYNILKSTTEEIGRLNRAYKEQVAVTKSVKEATKGIFGAEALRLEMERESLVISRTAKELELARIKSILNEEDIADNEKVIQLEAEIAGISELILSNYEIQLRQQKESLNITEMQNSLRAQELSLLEKQVKTLYTIDNVSKGLSSTLTPVQEYETQRLALENALRVAEDEFSLAVARSQIEMAIVEAKFAYLVSEGRLSEERAKTLTDYLQTQLRIQTQMAEVRVQEAKEAIKAQPLQGIVSPAEQFGVDGPQQFIQGLDIAITKMNELTATGKYTKDQLNSIFISLTATAINPMIEKLSQLGPEGEVASKVAEGALVMASAFETIAAAGFSSAEGLAATASVIDSLGSIQQASSKQAIAAIDSEIEAEKRRDGKSKESLAKIAALEKKKEAREKKAFEQNKKMQMASILINTAAGIMKTIGETGFFGIPLAAIVAAMGAAQLAIVASTSYEGGAAGSPSASGPSSVSLGERQNTIDLARSRSPSGELAYMQGARGTGTGASNFIPVNPGGFAGLRSRAAGGSTGFMVGEQGPELFIPDRPGTVVPADDTSKMGSPVNVNFSINAIDTQGMQDALLAQRGNIIGMLREAANSHGEFFMERVNIRDDNTRLR